MVLADYVIYDGVAQIEGVRGQDLPVASCRPPLAIGSSRLLRIYDLRQRDTGPVSLAEEMKGSSMTGMLPLNGVYYRRTLGRQIAGWGLRKESTEFSCEAVRLTRDAADGRLS